MGRYIDARGSGGGAVGMGGWKKGTGAIAGERGDRAGGRVAKLAYRATRCGVACRGVEGWKERGGGREGGEGVGEERGCGGESPS